MCGLSGVMSSTISWQEESMFRDLLSVSSLRGYEGSGVIVSQKRVMKSNPAIRCIRTPLISGALANSGELQELLKPSVNVVIGHARWPTKGGNDIQAVHPHRAGHIVGVHNGTLNRVAGKDVKDQSDSKLLFESFAEIGVVDTIKESDGAYALVWIDEHEQTLNFLRNFQRPMFFKNVGWNKNISTLYWASEREMLDFVFKRTYKGENTWDTYLPVDTWFKYPLDVRHMIVPEKVVKDVKPTPKVYPAYHNFRGHQNRSAVFDHDDENERWSTWEKGLVSPLALPAPSGNVSSISKAQAKRNEKLAKQEAAARLKSQGKFHNVTWDAAVQDYVPREGKKDTSGNMADVVRALGERMSGEEANAIAASTIVSDHFGDLGRQPIVTTYEACAGKACAWCGTAAEAGDKVYPVGSSDLGDKTFVCWDCGSYPGCNEFIDETRVVTVSPY